MNDLKLSSKVRSKAFGKYIGEKVVIFHIQTGLVNPGILVGKTKFTIRLKTTSGETRYQKDDIFLLEYSCYSEIVDLVMEYMEKRTSLEILVSKYTII